MYIIANKLLIFLKIIILTKKEYFPVIFKHDEVLLIRIKVFMTNEKYHITHFLTNDQSILTFKNQKILSF
jgi:hypothetical protein